MTQSFRQTSLKKYLTLGMGGLMLGLSLGVSLWTSTVMAADITPAVNPDKVFTPKQREAIVEILRQALKDDPSILGEAVQSMREKALAQQQDTSLKGARAGWSQISAAPAYAVRGNPQGKVTVVEFLDPRCGYCRHMAPEVTAFLKRHPEVRFVEKVVPVLGPASLTATRAIYAAAQQGKYAEMRDALLLSPAQPDEARLKKLAREMGLDVPRFLKDMDSPAVNGIIAQNLGQAQQVNVEGTPTFLFGQEAVLPGAATGAQMDAALARAQNHAQP